MCAPISKGKWSWKFEKCVKCGTRKIKHKGQGLCLHCFDKKRAEDPKRKENLKNNHLRWWLKVKGTEEHKKYAREHVSAWQKKQPRLHKRTWQKKNLKLSFKKFILSNRKVKNGLSIRIGEKIIKTNIIAPKMVNSEYDDTIRKIELFKKAFYELGDNF